MRQEKNKNSLMIVDVNQHYYFLYEVFLDKELFHKKRVQTL